MNISRKLELGEEPGLKCSQAVSKYYTKCPTLVGYFEKQCAYVWMGYPPQGSIFFLSSRKVELQFTLSSPFILLQRLTLRQGIQVQVYLFKFICKVRLRKLWERERERKRPTKAWVQKTGASWVPPWKTVNYSSCKTPEGWRADGCLRVTSPKGYRSWLYSDSLVERHSQRQH